MQKEERRGKEQKERAGGRERERGVCVWGGVSWLLQETGQSKCVSRVKSLSRGEVSDLASGWLSQKVFLSGRPGEGPSSLEGS